MKNRIKQVVQEQGRTLKWVASESGMDLAKLYHWSQNERHPSIFELKELSVFLDVTMEDLIE